MLVVTQDDTAPDSIETFQKEFKTITGMTMDEFEQVAFTVQQPMGFLWKHKDFSLEWYCDDPFYRLTVGAPLNPEKTNEQKLRTVVRLTPNQGKLRLV